MGCEAERTRAFQVELSPEAWRQVGALPREAFVRLRAQLDALALAAAAAPLPATPETLFSPDAGAVLAVPVEEYAVLYTLDLQRRAMVVQGMVRRARGQGEAP